VPPGIILLSKKNPKIETAENTILALEKGAFDFVTRPEKESEDVKISVLRRKLLPKIRSYSIRRYTRVAKEVQYKTKEKDSYTSKTAIKRADRMARKLQAGSTLKNNTKIY